MKSYIRTFLFAIVVFAILWYLSGTISALDFVKKPEIVFGLAVLLIAILFNGKVVKNLNDIQYEKLSEEEKEKQNVQNNWLEKMYKKSLGTKPIEEEHEIILDHNYDGIKELDNNLPPWWVYSFYASIIFAVFYMFKYEVFDGDNQYDELATEYADAKISIAEYKKTAKNLVDFNTVELLTEASDLEKGKLLYETNCVACHKADGGGGIGPNLTDENWILGGGIKNVFKTVSEGGRDGKGMIAWKSSLKPVEIAQVSSYLLQFQGTTSAEPKAPEGDIWEVDNNE
ncbi:MAG: cytochrome C oxidase subunit III [Lutibacter sp.]|nr:MAG: cytochrome C oxidase subunit III [Lutibacter sp.]